MTITKNFVTLEHVKTSALYAIAFFVLVFGNAFRSDVIAFGWMFSVGLIMGYLHRLHERIGIIGFVVPAIGLFSYALLINFQYVFLAETLFTLSGYYFANQLLKSRVHTGLAVAAVLFAVVLFVTFISTPIL
jgi:hypothetical protein